MGEAIDLREALSERRFQTYLDAAGNDMSKADELYRWNCKLAGVLHYQIGLFEVLTRNALDRELRKWSDDEYSFEDWTDENAPTNEIHTLIKSPLAKARSHAHQASRNRRPGHPRRQAPITHDDVVTQLSMGAWSTLLGESPAAQATETKLEAAQTLWEDALCRAFRVQNAIDLESERVDIGRKLQRTTDLRNRVSHQENLLEVKVRNRLQDMTSVLQLIDPRIPRWFMKGSELRRVAKQDPRRGWVRGGSRTTAWD